MKRVGFDRLCVRDASQPGAGIRHAATELFEACTLHGSAFDLACVTEPPFDAFFAATGTVPWSMRVPTFPWVHDLSIFSHPEWFPQSWVHRQYTTRKFLYGLTRAQHIFCVSEDTRRILKTHLPSLQKVTVTHEGVQRPKTIALWDEREDQVLMLGTVEPRKNIPFILDIWPAVCRILGRPVRLVVAGKDGWGNVAVTSSETIERRVSISDQERDALLKTSRLILVPSLHEGFGRVVLEAMAFGTPVIASAVGAHSEVVGQRGMLLDPQDRTAWINTIASLFTDRGTWQAQQDRGRDQAALFSWDDVAKQILAVIRDG